MLPAPAAAGACCCPVLLVLEGWRGLLVVAAADPDRPLRPLVPGGAHLLLLLLLLSAAAAAATGGPWATEPLCRYLLLLLPPCRRQLYLMPEDCWPPAEQT
jgi:polyferredoxin